jgi:hypothetical protein
MNATEVVLMVGSNYYFLQQWGPDDDVDDGGLPNI